MQDHLAVYEWLGGLSCGITGGLWHHTALMSLSYSILGVMPEAWLSTESTWLHNLAQCGHRISSRCLRMQALRPLVRVQQKRPTLSM